MSDTDILTFQALIMIIGAGLIMLEVMLTTKSK